MKVTVGYGTFEHVIWYSLRSVTAGVLRGDKSRFQLSGRHSMSITLHFLMCGSFVSHGLFFTRPFSYY
jgi:hypothetical protein